ncbi:MAG: Gfo/Idh/MocA family oxidoreductase, partial [Coriobacteriia bacterium]|nr:Gfo/Idh/MocA family oxidoreductase [Coriobacteriia bacterium]
MKQVFLGGPSGVVVKDVPAPALGPGEVLVRVAHSLISTGTEGADVRGTAAKAGSPLERVLREPALVAKAAKKLARDGFGATAEAVGGSDSRDLTPLGYSAAGIVVETGSDVRNLSAGDRVTCGGGGYASHAEFISVPKNLVARIPERVSTEHAAFVTLGAIAMQGVRRAEAGLGDRVGVVGLGLLGQLGVQLASTAGCRVIAFDLDADRVALARELGASEGIVSDEADSVNAAVAFTDGVGLDAVLIFAGTKSSDVVNEAFQMTRERGRVVIVGAVGMDLERKTFYAREQDLLISRSYGPGRYDAAYEEGGQDYPVAYVRWTENRNMGEVLRLMADGILRIDPLVSAVYPIEQAEEAYQFALEASGSRIATLLSYSPAERQPTEEEAISRVTVLRTAPEPSTDEVRFGIIGAGSFARTFHIPNLAKMPGGRVLAVAGRRGPSATSSAKRADAVYAATDHAELLRDGDIDAVIIATRHDSHASLAAEAARAGKHVFVEKPLALTAEDCVTVAEAVADAGILLTVGFNRRFSPHAQHVKRVLDSRRGPRLMTYRVNAGFKPADHWVFDPVEGGGRIIGEACHF